MKPYSNLTQQLLLTALFAAAVCCAACAPAAGTDGSAPPPARPAAGSVDAAAMLAAHNQWRAKTGVPALAWSESLAAEAQQWANQLAADNCALEHSRTRHGENLYMGSPLIGPGGRVFQNIPPQEVVDAWGEEIKYYNYADNSCSFVCGHYTQLVWRDTKEVGCAAAVCSDKSQLWVCNYQPAGNLGKKRPY